MASAVNNNSFDFGGRYYNVNHVNSSRIKEINLIDEIGGSLDMIEPFDLKKITEKCKIIKPTLEPIDIHKFIALHEVLESVYRTVIYYKFTAIIVKYIHKPLFDVMEKIHSEYIVALRTIKYDFTNIEELMALVVEVFKNIIILYKNNMYLFLLLITIYQNYSHIRDLENRKKIKGSQTCYYYYFGKNLYSIKVCDKNMPQIEDISIKQSEIDKYQYANTPGLGMRNFVEGITRLPILFSAIQKQVSPSDQTYFEMDNISKDLKNINVIINRAREDYDNEYKKSRTKKQKEEENKAGADYQDEHKKSKTKKQKEKEQKEEEKEHKYDNYNYIINFDAKYSILIFVADLCIREIGSENIRLQLVNLNRILRNFEIYNSLIYDNIRKSRKLFFRKNTRITSNTLRSVPSSSLRNRSNSMKNPITNPITNPIRNEYLNIVNSGNNTNINGANKNNVEYLEILESPPEDETSKTPTPTPTPKQPLGLGRRRAIKLPNSKRPTLPKVSNKISLFENLSKNKRY